MQPFSCLLKAKQEIRFTNIVSALVKMTHFQFITDSRIMQDASQDCSVAFSFRRAGSSFRSCTYLFANVLMLVHIYNYQKLWKLQVSSLTKHDSTKRELKDADTILTPLLRPASFGYLFNFPRSSLRRACANVFNCKSKQLWILCFHLSS